MTIDREAMLASVDLESLLERIGDARDLRRRGKQFPCPVADHEQTGATPPVAVAADPAGYQIWKCHSCEKGGTAIDALVTSGRAHDVADAFEQLSAAPPVKPKPRRVIDRYPYTDEQGELLSEKERTDPKGFRQRRPDGKGGWTYNLDGVRRVLYRLPKVLEAKRAGEWLVVVEGERDVHAVEAAGKVATTMPGGAGKWLPEYTETLRGAKVAVICDNDEVGRKHALAVATALDGIAAKLKVYEPPSGFKDVGEMLAAGGSLKDLRPFDDTAANGNGNGNGNGELRVMTAKEIMQLPTPAEEGRLLGPLIYRGYRIVVGGHTGAGKTCMSLHMAAAVANGTQFLNWKGRGGERVLILDVEQGTRTIQRVLREVGLQDSEDVSYLRVPDGLALDKDQDAIKRMECVLGEGGYAMVVADPLYKLGSGDLNDARAAIDLMKRFDGWREQFNFSLVLPMHCRKPQMNSSLSVHDLFGSSGFQWGAEILLGIERKNDGCSHLHWWKDRDGDTEAKIGSYWKLSFKREKGYHRMEESEDKAARKSEAFSLREFIHDEIKASPDGVTQEEIKNRLWIRHSKSPTAKQLDNALEALCSNGVCHQGAHFKKDRVYRVPNSLC